MHAFTHAHRCSMKLLKTKQVCKQSIEYRQQITVVGSFIVHSVLFLVKCFVWLEVSYATLTKMRAKMGHEIPVAV